MTIEERLAALELRDERRESEHRKLLLDYEKVLTARETLRTELEKDYEFLGRSVDDRMAEFAKALAGAAPGDAQPMLRELAQIITAFREHTNECLGNLCDRVERIENYLGGKRVA